jgi:hypothetical protein
MPVHDPFLSLERFAACDDVHDLDAMLHEVRCAGRELCADRLTRNSELTRRLERLMVRLANNIVFNDPRAKRARELIGDLVDRLSRAVQAPPVVLRNPNLPAPSSASSFRMRPSESTRSSTATSPASALP